MDLLSLHLRAALDSSNNTSLIRTRVVSQSEERVRVLAVAEHGTPRGIVVTPTQLLEVC
jgi:hypothetical protein